MVAAAPPTGRSLVEKLQKQSLTALVALLAVLAGVQLLRTVKPPGGSADNAAHMPWVQQHLHAMRDAWREAGGAAAPFGWEEAVLFANTTRLTSGLAWEDVALGDGAPVQPTDILQLVYKLYVGQPAGADGAPRFVYSAADSAAPVLLRATGHGAMLLEGQLAALAGMRHGGRRRAVLPPKLGFGAAANERVPAYSTLLCFMELLPRPRPPPSVTDATTPRWEDDLDD